MSNVAVDARVLQTYPYTGVSYYLKHILEEWNNDATRDSVRLYINQLSRWQPPTFLDNYQITASRIPNKLLQASWSISKHPGLTRHIQENVLWMPNSNFIGTIGDKRLVLSIHDLAFLHFPEFYSRKMRMWHSLLSIRTLVRSANRIITFSTATKVDIIKSFSVDSERIDVIPHGVAEIMFNEPQHDIDWLPERYIAFLGSLEPRKNVKSAVAAFELITKNHPDVYFVIAGPEGWLSGESLRAIQNSPASSKIIYKGYVTDLEKHAMLYRAAAFIYPSFYEGFGLPVLEAMAAGCPVIAGAAGSLPELVGSAGMLIPPHQTYELAAAIDALLTDSLLADTFRKRGLMRAREYSWKKAAAMTYTSIQNA